MVFFLIFAAHQLKNKIMKLKIINVGIVLFLLAMSLASCNSDCERKLAKLQKSYDSLLNTQKELTINFDTNVLKRAKPIDSIEQGNIFYKNFMQQTNVVIPSSWRFEKTDFISLMSNNPEYVTLYPIVRNNNELSIMAVGTTAGYDDILTDASGNIMVFDFSKICPPDCSNANALNTVNSKLKLFKKHYFNKTGGSY